MNPVRNLVTKRLCSADIRIDGNRRWDIQVHDDRFYNFAFRGDLLRLGEPCMKGGFDIDRIDGAVTRLRGLNAGGSTSLSARMAELLYRGQCRFISYSR